MYDMSDKFANWLNERMKERGWNQSETAERANLSRTTISDFLASTAPIGFEACNKLAKAFNIYPPEVFRIAGLIPPVPEKDTKIEILVHRFSQLNNNDQQTILDLADFLLSK